MASRLALEISLLAFTGAVAILARRVETSPIRYLSAALGAITLVSLVLGELIGLSSSDRG